MLSPFALLRAFWRAVLNFGLLSGLVGFFTSPPSNDFLRPKPLVFNLASTRAAPMSPLRASLSSLRYMVRSNGTPSTARISSNFLALMPIGRPLSSNAYSIGLPAAVRGPRGNLRSGPCTGSPTSSNRVGTSSASMGPMNFCVRVRSGSIASGLPCSTNLPVLRSTKTSGRSFMRRRTCIA